ncbi:MAG TPA: glycosyltransferase family 9 protein [Armatimonadota bacterium]|nr:glycosyltransferase family 9 protein [Armatimonadota bacterium]
MKRAFGSSSAARSAAQDGIDMSSRITDCKRILIVKLSSIGDVVMTTPVAKALRNAYPESYIAWVVEDKSQDILHGNPYLDEVLVLERSANSKPAIGWATGFLVGLAKLAPKLRARKFDLAIDFQGLLRSALVARISGARCRVGYDNAREGATLFYDLQLPSRCLRVRGPQQYLNMLQILDIVSEDLEMFVPIGDDDREFARACLASASPDCEPARLACLCPATTWEQKHWTEDGWARLADALASEHDMLPVFLGSPADVRLVERITGSMSRKSVNAAGRTTLKQAAAILESSRLVIAVDTGLLHIAAALGRPTIGLFGPTRWRHFAKKDKFIVVAKDFPCMPCLRHPSCKHFDCMRAIAAEDILQAANPWLAGKVPARSSGEDVSSVE